MRALVMANEARPLRRRLLVAAKIAVSVALLAFLFLNYDSAEVRQLLVGIDGAALAAALLMAGLAICIAAFRWFVVVRALGIATPGPDVFRLTFVGVFFNQLLPSSIGGDVVRVWHLSVAGVRLATAVLSVLLDRLLALVALALMMVGGMPWLFGVVANPTVRLTLLGAALAIICGLTLLLTLGRVLAIVRRVLPWLASALAELSEAARTIFLKPRAGSAGLLLSLLIHGLTCGIVYALAKGLGYELAATATLFLVPPVIFASVLPVSIGGWGVREGAMVVVLGFVGIPAEGALAISILFGLSLAAVSLPGGLLWLTIGRERVRP